MGVLFVNQLQNEVLRSSPTYWWSSHRCPRSTHALYIFFYFQHSPPPTYLKKPSTHITKTSDPNSTPNISRILRESRFPLTAVLQPRPRRFLSYSSHLSITHAYCYKLFEKINICRQYNALDHDQNLFFFHHLYCWLYGFFPVRERGHGFNARVIITRT